jgi:hypothetical protein
MEVANLLETRMRGWPHLDAAVGDLLGILPLPLHNKEAISLSGMKVHVQRWTTDGIYYKL